MKSFQAIQIWIAALIIITGAITFIPSNSQAAFIVWPGDHIIDGVTEYYGPGDIINAGGDVLIINDGVLILDGAILNFTVALKAISVGSTGNGTFSGDVNDYRLRILLDGQDQDIMGTTCAFDAVVLGGGGI